MTFARHKNRPVRYRQAKRLQQTGSIVEKLLRRAIREQENVFDVKFRYQYPIDPYIVDFVCLTARLIVEVDGLSHDSQILHDKKRQDYPTQRGFQILNFANADVMNDVIAIAVTMCEQGSQLQKARWNETPPRMCSAHSTLPQGEGN